MDNILKYENLVNKIAYKYSKLANFEDLKQAGMVGLINAVNNYKSSENTKFSTYAYLWIKGEILEFLRLDKGIKISKEMISLSKKITNCQEILRNKLDREPTVTEMALFLEVDEYLIEEALLSREIVLSCDSRINKAEDGKDISLYDMVPYYEKKYDASYLDLYSALDNLDEEERKLIRYRYFDDMTQKEVSNIFGTNQVNISRKEEKILTKLNKSLVA